MNAFSKISKFRFNVVCVVFSISFLTLMSFTTNSKKNSDIDNSYHTSYSFIEESLTYSEKMSTRFGIPATLLTSVAIYCSQEGQSLPAKHANNHFNMLLDDMTLSQDENTFQHKGQSYRSFSRIEKCYQSFVVHLLSQSTYDNLATVNWITLLDEQGMDMEAISKIHMNLLRDV